MHAPKKQYNPFYHSICSLRNQLRITILPLCEERCSKIEEGVKMGSQMKEGDWNRRKDMINRNTTRVPLTLAVAVSCRRYCTLGGNLRNVPVRVDCRWGKRSKRLSLLVLVRINRLSHSYSHNHNLSNITWLPLRSFKFCFQDKRIKEFGLTSSWDVFDGILARNGIWILLQNSPDWTFS